jgi:hypothetical protein
MYQDQKQTDSDTPIVTPIAISCKAAPKESLFGANSSLSSNIKYKSSIVAITPVVAIEAICC